MYPMYPSERIFADYLESQGKTYKAQPKTFKFAGMSYRPDFYCIEENTYYEVIATRGAYYRLKKKMECFVKTYPHMKFKIVKPNGEKYYSSKYIDRIPNKKQINFQIKEEVDLKFKAAAKEDDMTPSQVLRKLIKQYIFAKKLLREMKEKGK